MFLSIMVCFTLASSHSLFYEYTICDVCRIHNCCLYLNARTVHRFIVFFFKSTNAQTYISQQCVITDCSHLHVSTSLYHPEAVSNTKTSHRIYCITQRRPNNIVTYFNPTILCNCNCNRRNFKN